MQNLRNSIRSTLRLTARGEATAAAYSRCVAAAPREDGQPGALARTAWAASHGLDTDDGPYLLELALDGKSLGALGEALAVHSQTREQVYAVIERLVGREFVELVPIGVVVRAPAQLRAVREVDAAEVEYAVHCDRVRVTVDTDRRVIDAELREAVFRRVVARRFLASLG